MMPEPQKRISAKKVLLTSFVVDLLDIILNLSVALLSGSVVMLTEFLEGVADLTSSGLLMVGLRRSGQKADRSHPFGYTREIYFWTLLAALLMFGITSSLSIYFGWHRFINHEEIQKANLALLILAITFVTNSYAFSLSLKRLLKDKSVKSIVTIFFRSSLIETKTTFILDAMGASAAFLGMVSLGIYALTGDSRFDGLGAMVIGVVIAVLSIFLILAIRDLLVGRSASPETEEKIRKAALTVEEVKEVLGLRTLHIGLGKLLVNLDVHMEDELDTDELEVLIDKIKENIRKEVPSVDYLQVELETPSGKI